MSRERLLVDSESLVTEFNRCCQEYTRLQLAVAWSGDPGQQVLPYASLQAFHGRIDATIGVSFNQTHPAALTWFEERTHGRLRIFRDDSRLFHPKVYLFTKGRRFALFIGSSNFTYGGFYSNVEVNCLIEDTLTSGVGPDISSLQRCFDAWRSDIHSFSPTRAWLQQYKAAYRHAARVQQRNRVRSPSQEERDFGPACWLRNADWALYFDKVSTGLRQHEGKGEAMHNLLNTVERLLPLPWRPSIFSAIGNRRLIGGMHGDEGYAHLGHVAASRQFRHLMANGTAREKAVIVNCVNKAASMETPIQWARLTSTLKELGSLGCSMKVWGRLLCLVRPDLYCTVASDSVRAALSQVLHEPRSTFETPEGYVSLIRLIHSSPWFNSPRPKVKNEEAVWRRRVAFLDGVFYYFEPTRI